MILSSRDLLERKAKNTIEFHWYAAEEAGTLGSQALFLDYARSGKDVRAMLQQDMTGFYNSTIKKEKETVWTYDGCWCAGFLCVLEKC